MALIHEQLTAGRWHTLSLVEQLANVGSDVTRAAHWWGKDQQRCEKAFDRTLELLDLTIAGERWKGQRKELTRARELLCDAMFGGNADGSDSAALDRYFFHFAMAARVGQ
ncbi:MAG: hypothetical protein P0119_14370 [Nitrospira sp.]|nr:hypothetical protein [Nitrospira sp.]